MTNLQIECEYCQELWLYASIGINDRRTDGDRLIANMVAGLIADKMLNKERFNNFLTDSLNNLEV